MGLGGFNRSLTFSFRSFGSESCPSLASFIAHGDRALPEFRGASHQFHAQGMPCDPLFRFACPSLEVSRHQGLPGPKSRSGSLASHAEKPHSQGARAHARPCGHYLRARSRGCLVCACCVWRFFCCCLYIYIPMDSFSMSPSFLFNSWFFLGTRSRRRRIPPRLLAKAISQPLRKCPNHVIVLWALLCLAISL